MSRSWLRALAAVFAVLLGVLPNGATAAAARATFTYDAPSNARVDVHHATGADAADTQLTAAREVSAPSSVGSLGPSTTPVAAFLATNSIPRLGSVADDLTAARAHLGSIDDALEFGPNRAMLGSIDDAVAAGRPLTSAERAFLDHELLEAKLVGSGMDQAAAHAQVLQTIPVGANYSPAVLKQYSEWFSQAYFDYWGLTK